MAKRYNNLEGILYQKEGSYWIQSPDGTDSTLQDLLDRISGETVKVLLHAGKGSCLWGKAECPAGHRTIPDLELTFQEDGTLSLVGGKWKVGGKAIPFHLFEGHRCSFEAYPCVEDLHRRARRLLDTLHKVQKLSPSS
jgi:hypothetical protein